MNPHELPLSTERTPGQSHSIKLIGIGGGGSNAVTRLALENIPGIQSAIIDTDRQALAKPSHAEKIPIGHGLSAGGEPEVGFEAADADREKIRAFIGEADLVFLAVSLGGGTGGGAAPVVAEVAGESGALVIAFASMPFSFEKGRRAKQAEDGLAALRRACDAVIPLPNDLLLQQTDGIESLPHALARADEWIGRGVRSIWSVLNRTGIFNINLEALQQAFHSRGGKTLYSIGSASGENLVADALESLRACPLVHTPDSARKVDRLLVNIIGGPDLTLPQINEIMPAITDLFGRDAHVIMGAVVDESMRNRVEICVLGTTDVGTRHVPPRRPIRTTQAPVTQTDSDPKPDDSSRSPAKQPAPQAGDLFASHNGSTKPGSAQDEFLFDAEAEQRGTFQNTDRNLFEGQDLDVPTYLRKGIKITT